MSDTSSDSRLPGGLRVGEFAVHDSKIVACYSRGGETKYAVYTTCSSASNNLTESMNRALTCGNSSDNGGWRRYIPEQELGEEIAFDDVGPSAEYLLDVGINELVHAVTNEDGQLYWADERLGAGIGLSEVDGDYIHAIYEDVSAVPKLRPKDSLADRICDVIDSSYMGKDRVKELVRQLIKQESK
jgi:hypothetical protein